MKILLLCFLLSGCSVVLHPVGKKKQEAKKQDLYAMVFVFIFTVWALDGAFDKK